MEEAKSARSIYDREPWTTGGTRKPREARYYYALRLESEEEADRLAIAQRIHHLEQLAIRIERWSKTLPPYLSDADTRDDYRVAARSHWLWVAQEMREEGLDAALWRLGEALGANGDDRDRVGELWESAHAALLQAELLLESERRKELRWRWRWSRSTSRRKGAGRVPEAVDALRHLLNEITAPDRFKSTQDVRLALKARVRTEPLFESALFNQKAKPRVLRPGEILAVGTMGRDISVRAFPFEQKHAKKLLEQIRDSGPFEAIIWVNYSRALKVTTLKSLENRLSEIRGRARRRNRTERGALDISQKD